MTFEIYKKGQGNAARLVTGVGALCIAGFGSLALREYLKGSTAKIAVATINLELGMLLAFMVFVACAAAVAWQVLTAHWLVDFLILTEAELRKVSWPTKRDLYQQTIVVVVVSVMVGIVVLIVDLIFSKVLQAAGVI